jgi:hypothetical protein
VVGPFVCAGVMLMPSVSGGTLNVQRNFRWRRCTRT